MKQYTLLSFSFSLLLSLCFTCIGAQAQTVDYTYDALGRVTYVQDATNGNRDYDYDKAGNRLLVATSTANDDAASPSTPTPPSPTGLNFNLAGDCYYNVYWNASAGATYYNFRTTTEQLVVTGTSTSVNCPWGNRDANKPVWIQACAAGLCSSKAYF